VGPRERAERRGRRRGLGDAERAQQQGAVALLQRGEQRRERATIEEGLDQRDDSVGGDGQGRREHGAQAQPGAVLLPVARHGEAKEPRDRRGAAGEGSTSITHGSRGSRK
jgi:hypothetical protein